MNKYSVLLLYPDYLNHSGTDTYYEWTEAETPQEAVENVREMARQANARAVDDASDFATLLVLDGHVEAIEA